MSALAVALVVSAVAGSALAMGRPLVLRRSVFELGLGLGLGRDAPAEATGLGVNLELGYGIGSDVELRGRTGIRFGQDGRVADADVFARPFETESLYSSGGDTVANPEIGLRFALARGRVVELGLDARFYLPVGSRAAALVGLPLLLHLGSRARLDTGVYVPLLFEDPIWHSVSLPLHLWIQVDGGISLGPMTGIRVHHGGGQTVPMGLGLASALDQNADLRAWILFPDVSASGSAKSFGAGVGVFVGF